MWRHAVPCCLLAAAGASGTAQPAAYTLDPTHTFAGFDFDAGLTTVRVRFDRKQGRIEFDRAGRSGAVEVEIDMASLSSGMRALDEHLRSAAAFDTARFPQATFRSERFVFDGRGVSEVQGSLTLRGQSRPLTLTALRFDCYFNPLFRRQVCGGDFEATLNSSGFGLPLANGPAPAPVVRLIVQVEAIAP